MIIIIIIIINVKSYVMSSFSSQSKAKSKNLWMLKSLLCYYHKSKTIQMLLFFFDKAEKIKYEYEKLNKNLHNNICIGNSIKQV